MRARLVALGFLVTSSIVTLHVGCAGNDAPPVLATQATTEPRDLSGLERVLRVSDSLYSGGEPDGERGYQSLAAMGVRTVVSVDAVPPPAALAREHGIRVIHIPIGYDHVPQDAAIQIAKVFTESEGAVYVHCHHGQHRGPAAIAAACIVAELLDHTEAIALMEQAGTARIYKGLWSSVEDTRVVDPETLYLIPTNQPERAEIGGLAGAMAEIDRAWDRIKIAQKHHWQAPAEHPDLAPQSDIGLIHDLLRSLLNDDLTLRSGDTYGNILKTAIDAAADIESSLANADLSRADVARVTLAQTCTDCHQLYRD